MMSCNDKEDPGCSRGYPPNGLPCFYPMFFLLMLLLAIPGAGYADDFVPDDFAWGMMLKVPGESAFYSISLPAEVYRGAYRADLGDIRVFNGQKETVSHTLKAPETTPVPSHPPVPLPFFPLYGPKEGAAGDDVSLRVNTAKDGTIIDVRTGGEKSAANRLQAILLDLTPLENRTPSGLVLGWKPETPDFVATISVDGSSDLADWEPLVSRAALAEQHFAGHALFKNRIMLGRPGQPVKYLRINWPENGSALELTTAEAVFPLKESGPERQWLKIEGKPSPEKGTLVYEYDTAGAFPVDRVNIGLPEKNSLIRAVLRSRPDRRSEWRWRGNLMVYRISLDGATLSNEAVSLATLTGDRYWRVEAAAGAGLGKTPPVLEIGWIPHELVFLARGEAPFTLAFGSAGTGPTDSSVRELLQGIDQTRKKSMIREASAGERFVLGGPSRLEKPLLIASWKTWVLWTVLVCGVMLMAFFAVRLYRQMDGKS